MVEIKAFRGYCYNTEKVDLQDVITPPYDVVDNEMKNNLRKKSEFNFVNLILNESHDKSNELFNKWIKENILVKDEEDSIYVYNQEFNLENKKFKRIGFICLLKVEELGNNILPHEKTFEKCINDRFELMVKTKSNLEQIFMIYQDKDKEIDKITIPLTGKKEDLEFIDNDKCKHRIYKINDRETISKIISLMGDKKLLIADGHHRYKTALRYKEKYGYVMATLVNSDNEGLVILPVNRVLDEKIDINNLKEYFNIKETEDLVFSNKSFIVAAKNAKYMIELKKQTEIKSDVEVLHNLVFENILKISRENQKPPKVNFYKGNKETFDALNGSNTAFFVNPPELDKLFKIVANNRVLPQKSTYFYPKMFSGLVINKF